MVVKRAQKVIDYALERPFRSALALGAGSIVGMKALGLTTTDKWENEAPYTPEPTSQQTNAITSRAQAIRALAANKKTIDDNDKRIDAIDREIILGDGISVSQFTTLFQEKAQKQQQNIELKRQNEEHERAIKIANETIIPYRDKISDWYVKNGPLTYEWKATASSLIFAAGGGYLVYNLLGEGSKFSYKGRSKRRPATTFGFTA